LKNINLIYLIQVRIISAFWNKRKYVRISHILRCLPIKSKNFATLVWYLSLVIGALIALTNNVQGSSSDSSDNFFLDNFSIHLINCETHLKALISERARRDEGQNCPWKRIQFIQISIFRSLRGTSGIWNLHVVGFYSLVFSSHKKYVIWKKQSHKQISRVTRICESKLIWFLDLSHINLNISSSVLIVTSTYS